MKKIFTVVVLLALSISFKPAQAQFEYIGGGVALATGGEYRYGGYSYYNKSFGIDLRAVYDYSKKLQIVPDFKVYFPYKESFTAGGEAKTTVVAFNLNAHYILNPRPRTSYRLYFLGGAHFSGWFLKDDRVSVTEIVDVNEFKFIPGVNAGAGMQFQINANFLFFAEAKYVVSKANQLVFTPGFLIVL